MKSPQEKLAYFVHLFKQRWPAYLQSRPTIKVGDPMTLENFLIKQRMFLAKYHGEVIYGHKIDPQGYPLEMPEEDWYEQYFVFIENLENNV